MSEPRAISQDAVGQIRAVLYGSGYSGVYSPTEELREAHDFKRPEFSFHSQSVDDLTVRGRRIAFDIYRQPKKDNLLVFMGYAPNGSLLRRVSLLASLLSPPEEGYAIAACLYLGRHEPVSTDLEAAPSAERWAGPPYVAVDFGNIRRGDFDKAMALLAEVISGEHPDMLTQLLPDIELPWGEGKRSIQSAGFLPLGEELLLMLMHNNSSDYVAGITRIPGNH